MQFHTCIHTQTCWKSLTNDIFKVNYKTETTKFTQENYRRLYHITVCLQNTIKVITNNCETYEKATTISNVDSYIKECGIYTSEPFEHKAIIKRCILMWFKGKYLQESNVSVQYLSGLDPNLLWKLNKKHQRYFWNYDYRIIWMSVGDTLDKRKSPTPSRFIFEIKHKYNGYNHTNSVLPINSSDLRIYELIFLGVLLIKFYLFVFI